MSAMTAAPHFVFQSTLIFFPRATTETIKLSTPKGTRRRCRRADCLVDRMTSDLPEEPPRSPPAPPLGPETSHESFCEAFRLDSN